MVISKYVRQKCGQLNIFILLCSCAGIGTFEILLHTYEVHEDVPKSAQPPKKPLVWVHLSAIQGRNLRGLNSKQTSYVMASPHIIAR